VGSRNLSRFPPHPAHNAAMRKWVHVALAVFLVAVGGVVAWEILRPHELNPIVDGKRLTTWLEGQSDEASRALEKVGTNAIPTLLWMLRQTDSPFKSTMVDLFRKQHFIKVHHIPAEQHNHAAYLAFRKLGARADVAVPALIEIYEQKLSPSSQQAAARSLGSIGPPAKQAIPVLILGMTDTNALLRIDLLRALADLHAEPDLVVPALTNALNDANPGVSVFAFDALWEIGEAAKPAVPALVKAVHNSEPSARGGAVRALLKIAPDAVVPALTNALYDTNSEVRLFACISLWEVGVDARRGVPPLANVVKQALPALVKAANDLDSGVRERADWVLRQIDPEAAAKAGVK